MRIGEFSRRHNVTVDSIRHYIDLGLILPEKDGAHFSFGDVCSLDIEEIKRLKKLKFSLSEIRKLFIIRRITNLEEDENRKFYRSFFLEKKNSLISEREKINEMIAEIDRKVEMLCVEKEKRINKLGVPVGSLSIFHCPKCKGLLKLNSAQIDNSMVMDGKLACRCGFEALIENGIIILELDREIAHKKGLNGTLKEYIENTSPEYINFMYRTIEWIVRRAEFNSNFNNIILEPGTGSGFFLKQVNSLLPKDMLYISVDHNIEMVKFVKSYLETHSNHTNFVFICCDFSQIPVKDNTIDLVFDFYGSTNYNFRETSFLMDLLDSKVKPDGRWYGVYFCLDKYSKTVMQYPPECRPYFYKDNLLRKLGESSFRMLDSADLGCVNRAGEFEPFFIEGDNLYALAYYGRKTLG